MKTRTIIIIIAAVAVVAAVVFFARPLLTKPDTVEPAPPPDYWPTDGWRASTPEEQGFDSVALAEELIDLREDGIPVDSLLMIRNGYVFLDANFAPYDGTFPHDMASVTKSITTTLIGIAAAQGKVDVDAPVLSFFTDRTIANVDDRKQAMTVRHLAGMVSGFDSGCLEGDEATLDAMRAAPDWIQQSLDRPMMRKPGLAFCYDSPGMHILSAIIQEQTGMTEVDFARQYLFGPLGINDFTWESDPQGYTDGWGDIHLFPRDAAKLGLLFLQGGMWEGKQILPEEWVRDAVTAHVRADGEDDYGLGWWVSDDSFWALGRGGQHVKVFPEYQAIIMVTAAGLDFDKLEPLLRSSFQSPTEPLPPNLDGVAALKDAVASLAKDERVYPVAEVPALAGTISGRTYVFGPDAAKEFDLSTLMIEFDSATEGVMNVTDTSGMNIWPFGLDGSYRQSEDVRAMRGYWSDDRTFVFEMFDIGQLTYYLRFEGDRVLLTSDNVAGEFEGIAEGD